MNPNSIKKLKIECIEDCFGSMVIQIDWDETDPDLQWWTDLGEKGQKEFMISALTHASQDHVS